MGAPVRAGAALAVLLGVSALGVGPAAAEPLRLPAPAAGSDAPLLDAVDARPDRALTSVVPGPARNDEVVLVQVDGSGAPAVVQVEQRVVLTGVGDYQVRERGPARAAVALGDESAPVTKFGAVVWQGFTPGDRELAALLTLDPVLEGPRLPLRVDLAFTGADGLPAPLGPGGAVPGAGTVTVTVTNTTGQPAELPTAGDADAAALAPVLDALRATATAPAGPRLPVAGAALPAAVEVDGPLRRQGTQDVPLRLEGALTLVGTTGSVSGPGTTPGLGGATVAGTLAGSAVLTAVVDGPGRLALDLSAVPALDPRLLVPPGGAASWADWAAAGPPQPERVAALDLLVQAAATGVRAGSFSPYLGADLPGTGSTEFRVVLAPPPPVVAAAAPLEPRPGAIALAGVAALLLLGNGALLWRRA